MDLVGLAMPPVTVAQGELVGIKLFQDYHRSRVEDRDAILMPKSVHEANFVTARMAGFFELGIVHFGG